MKKEKPYPVTDHELNSRVHFRTRFHTDKHPGLTTPEKSLTFQSEAADCDINNIMKKFKNTGQLPSMINKNPTYGDFSSVTDYQESLNTVMKAQEQFEALPSKIRNRFNNDPAEFLEFTMDPKNLDELADIGILKKRQVDPAPTGGQQPEPAAGEGPKT